MLSGVLDAFEELVESLKAFWDEMDEMDARFWVLHPKGDVSYAETQRRIGLGAVAPIDAMVDPMNNAYMQMQRPASSLWLIRRSLVRFPT